MRQDGAKMRIMKDVSSVLGPWRRYEGEHHANSPASRGPGEVPPLGRVNPSRLLPQNPDSCPQLLNVMKTCWTSFKIGGFPETRFRHVALRLAKTLQDAPKTFKMPPRRPQDAPKTLPRRSKMPPRRPRDASKSAPRRSKTPLSRPEIVLHSFVICWRSGVIELFLFGLLSRFEAQGLGEFI